jgi:hypothetical protein
VPFMIPRISRVALGIQYAMLAASGAWLMSGPSLLLRETMGKVVYGWAAFLVIGGTLCLVGTLTKIWFGEFTGLILLMFANVMWGAALLGNGGTSPKYGLTLIAWAFGFLFRWGEIRQKVRKAVRAEKDRADGGKGGPYVD